MAEKNKMLLPIVRRLFTAGVVLWLAATVAFFAIHGMPGKIEDVLAGDVTYPGLREAIAAQWGLNRSLPLQYGQFLLRLAHGDLGTSFVLQEPVVEVLRSQIVPTMALAGAAAVLAFVLATAMAMLTTHATHTASSGAAWVGRCASMIELAFASTPVFWLGIFLLMIFSFHFHLFPVAGARGWRSLVLPAFTLALPTAGVLSQVMREALEVALQKPFVLTIRARGVPELTLRFTHLLRHALPPVLTLGGWLIGGLLGGAVITEKMFGRPGIGSVTLAAVTSQDVPVVLAVVLLAAFVHVVISTLLDIVYLLIDPRLRGT
jgi:peptide/nickel transport system permease protein